MKYQNIDNLISLWTLASKPFNAYKESNGFHVIAIDFSEWPNRIWQDPKNESTGIRNIKKAMQQRPTGLTYTKWVSLAHEENENSGLTLKSVQIGMSLNLQHYSTPASNSNLFLNKVDNEQKAVLWSELFHNCFNYSVSHTIVDKIKDDVAFYLITANQNNVGCVATYIKDNQIGIHSLGVLPNYRKQGFAEAAMHQLLQEAKSKNIVNAHLQSSSLGLGIYRKIGFEEIFKMYNYKI